LWIFHKFIQPYLIKFWNPWGSKSIKEIGEPPAGVDKDNAEFNYIKEKVTSHPVYMFSKTTCSFCKMAKDVLDGTNFEYTVEEIDGTSNMGPLQDMFQKVTGERTVPRVFVGGKCVGGGSDVFTLHNQGKLLPMMTEAGAKSKMTDKKSD